MSRVQHSLVHFCGVRHSLRLAGVRDHRWILRERNRHKNKTVRQKKLLYVLPSYYAMILYVSWERSCWEENIVWVQWIILDLIIVVFVDFTIFHRIPIDQSLSRFGLSVCLDPLNSVMDVYDLDTNTYHQSSLLDTYKLLEEQEGTLTHHIKYILSIMHTYTYGDGFHNHNTEILRKWNMIHILQLNELTL